MNSQTADTGRGGLRKVTAQQIVVLHAQAIDRSYVRRLAAQSYKNLGVDELNRVKVSGLEP